MPNAKNGKKGVLRFRVRCLQPLSHPSSRIIGCLFRTDTPDRQAHSAELRFEKIWLVKGGGNAFNEFMSQEQNKRLNRRVFLKKTGAIAAAVAGANLLQLPTPARAGDASVAIVLDTSDDLPNGIAPRWAAEELRDALAARGIHATIVQRLEDATHGCECVVATGMRSHLATQIGAANELALSNAPESFLLSRGRAAGNRAVLLAAGSDGRGLSYALLELADRVNLGGNPLDELKAIKPAVENPANSIRSACRLFAKRYRGQTLVQRSRVLAALSDNACNKPIQSDQSGIWAWLRFHNRHHGLLFSFRVPIFAFGSRLFGARGSVIG